MTETSWTWTADLEIPSETGAGERVVQQVLEQLERHSWIEHDIFGIHLAVEEALVNAIRHGNGLNPDKMVRIACRVSPDRFRIEITDEGSGFDPGDVPDPTEDENLEVSSGRGILLMRNFMSSVEFNGDGNQVVMEKCRE